ncbi:MAG TPA: outer membrane protein assembly factor BamE [Burkholderiales bacterium]|nr:outer membrane protein assembly factor BamE [Burkholderiales bacterium]
MRLRHLTALVLLLAGCSKQMLPTLPGLTPYKMDVQQGNVVTQEMIAKVQPGMSRSQVRFALGTPLIVDPFHSDRWDYVYFYQKGGVTTEQRRIAVIFKDDRLVRIDGDVVPAGAGGATPPAKTDRPAVPAPAATPQPQAESK